MRQTLKQRIIPEVDDRQLDRESGKVSSYVEKALKDISPIDPDSIFDMGDMMDHVSGMQEQSEDMFDDTFIPSGDFAADIAFSQEPSIAGGGTSNGGGGVAMEIADMFGGDMLSEMGNIGKQIGGLGRVLTGGAAVVGLGMLSLGILSGILGGVKKFAGASPLLGSVFNMLGLIKDLALMPIGNILGNLMLPIVVDLLALFAEFASIATGEGITGIIDGLKFVAGEFLGALFSLPGLIAVAITAGGALLGAKLGVAAGAKIGAVLGGILGSVIPGFGTAAGSVIGATIGGTLAAVLGILIAYNLDEMLDWISFQLSNIGDFLADIVFGVIEFLTPFALMGIEFYDWVRGVLSNISGYIQDLLGSILSGDVDELLDLLFGDTFDVLDDLFGGRFEVLSDLFDGRFAVLSMLFGGQFAVLSTLFGGRFNVLNTLFGGRTNIVNDVFGGTTSVVQDLFAGGYSSPRAFIGDLFGGYYNDISSLADDVFPDIQGSDIVSHVFPGGVDIPFTGGGGSSGGGGGSSGGLGSLWPFAEGGIVTGPTAALIGEGGENEVVAPLSKLDSMIQNRAGTNVDVSMGDSVGSVSMSERDLERAIKNGFEGANANEEMESTLKRVVREINRLRDDLDLSVEFTDESKWEVRR